MANHNNFDDLIRAAQDSQAAKQADRARQERQRQQAEELARQARTQAIEVRQRTLAMAEYAAQLLVAHGIAPTVQLQHQLPRTYTQVRVGNMFRHHQQWQTDPVRYETFAEGWPITHDSWLDRVLDFISDGGSEVYKTVIHSQGLLLTSDGRLVQYVDKRTGYPNEELGTITVHGPVSELSDDPEQNMFSGRFKYYAEEDMRWKLAQLVARSIPSYEAQQ